MTQAHPLSPSIKAALTDGLPGIKPEASLPLPPSPLAPVAAGAGVPKFKPGTETVKVIVAPGRCMVEADGPVVTALFKIAVNAKGEAIYDRRVVSAGQRNVLGGGVVEIDKKALQFLVANGTVLPPDD